MVTLKAVHEALGANPRFAMVSVACDSNLARSREYVENLHMDWEQAYERGLWMNLAKSYSVRSLPACFLISPDGHVRAKNVAGHEPEAGRDPVSGRRQAVPHRSKRPAPAISGNTVRTFRRTTASPAAAGRRGAVDKGL